MPDPHETPSVAGEGLVYDPPETAQRTTALGFLVDAFRRRRAGRAVLSGLTTVLFLAGAGMFSYPFFTDVYTEQVIQERLEDEFVRIEVQSFDEYKDAVQGQTGKALTKIAIPALEMETLVVEGTSPAALRAGAGHYPNTPLPGEVGNVAIAGHRTTYGRPFNRLDELKPGDELWLVTPVGDHRYVVTDEPASDRCRLAADGFAACITDPKDWGVIAPTADPVVTLTTCHPKGTARERLIIRAVLDASLPPGTYEARRDAGQA